MAPVSIRVSGDRELLRKFERLTDAVQGKTMERALTSGALIIQNAGKENAPVLTGNLRRSIHIGGHEDLNPDNGHIIDRSREHVPRPEIGHDTVAIYVGTDVNYAPAVEYGTVHQRPQPYMRPAADEHKGEVQREVADALYDLIQAAVR